jgi:UPF0755 protein
MKKIKLLMMVLSLAIMFGGCGLKASLVEPLDPNNQTEVMFTVPSGASTTKIAELLKEQELIKSVNGFKLLSKDLGSDGKMQAGDYMLSPSMSGQAIIEKLVAGDTYVETTTFTIPEGYEIRHIVADLEADGLIDSAIFYETLQNGSFDNSFLSDVDRAYNLEGYLFPDTYEIEVGATEHDIIQLMLNRFDRFLTDEVKAEIANKGLTLNEFVTMASIVEREAQLASERGKVASVFYNRIDKNMKFQSCATVQYVLGERKDVLSYDDIAIESPYNTYKYQGLTPSPIANPGEASLLAALNPEDTDYLYFRRSVKDDGSQVFSKTLREHEAARNK